MVTRYTKSFSANHHHPSSTYIIDVDFVHCVVVYYEVVVNGKYTLISCWHARLKTRRPNEHMKKE